MNNQRGFALVTVIVIVAALTAVVASVALIATAAVDRARIDREQLAHEQDSLSTQETLLFLLATQRMTVGGLTVDDRVVMTADDEIIAEAEGASFLPPPNPVGNEIRLDGRRYAGLGQVRFSVQDDRGLVSVNSAPPTLRRLALVSLLGESHEVPWDAFEDARLDFQDQDDLRRLNGAEAREARETGLPPPKNAAIDSPLELSGALHWKDALDAVDVDTVMGLLSASREAGVNINTAPPPVLALLAKGRTDLIERVLAQRAAQPFLTPDAFTSLVPLAEEEAEWIFSYPSPSGLIRLSSPGKPTRIVHWTLTPIDEEGGPWRIDFDLEVPWRGGAESTIGDEGHPAEAAPSPLLAQPLGNDRAG